MRVTWSNPIAQQLKNLRPKQRNRFMSIFQAFNNNDPFCKDCIMLKLWSGWELQQGKPLTIPLIIPL